MKKEVRLVRLAYWYRAADETCSVCERAANELFGLELAIGRAVDVTVSTRPIKGSCKVTLKFVSELGTGSCVVSCGAIRERIVQFHRRLSDWLKPLVGNKVLFTGEVEFNCKPGWKRNLWVKFVEVPKGWEHA